MPVRTDARSTSSSSAPATTGWSRPATWRGPGCRSRWSSPTTSSAARSPRSSAGPACASTAVRARTSSSGTAASSRSSTSPPTACATSTATPGASPPPRPRATPDPTGGRWSSRSTSTRPAPRSPRPAARSDAAAYRRFVAVWAPPQPGRGRLVRPTAHARRAGPLLLAAGRAVRAGSRAPPARDLAVDFLGSGDALLDRWFTSERLKAALAWFGAQSGPPMSEPGTAAMVGWAALLHDVPPGHPVGGSGGLTAALRRRLESDGGRVVLGDGAARLLVEDGRASPASRRRPDDGSAPARRGRLPRAGAPGTWPATHAPPALADADPPLGNGFGLVVRALTDALPAYPGRDRRAVAQGLQLLCTDRADLAAAHGDWAAGRLPRTPVPLAMSLLGQRRHPRAARPARRHDLGAVVPVRAGRRRRTGTTWPSREGRRLVDAVDRYAPGFADSVQRLYVQTPLQLERELSLPAWQRHARGDGAGQHVRVPADARARRLHGAGPRRASTSPAPPPTPAAGCRATPAGRRRASLLADRRPLARGRAAVRRAVRRLRP